MIPYGCYPIDPQGKTTIDIGRNITLRVSSKVLSLASPEFAHIFGPEPRTVLFTGDTVALTLLMKILHFKHQKVERLPSKNTQLLYNIALLCWKYGLVDAVWPWAQVWIPEGWDPAYQHEAWKEWLVISTVFKRADVFEFTSRVAAVVCKPEEIEKLIDEGTKTQGFSSDEPKGNRVYIGPLDYNTTNKCFRDFLQGFSIKSIKFVNEKREISHPYYALVDLESVAEAKRACSKLHGTMLLSRPVWALRSHRYCYSRRLWVRGFISASPRKLDIFEFFKGYEITAICHTNPDPKDPDISIAWVDFVSHSEAVRACDLDRRDFMGHPMDVRLAVPHSQELPPITGRPIEESSRKPRILSENIIEHILQLRLQLFNTLSIEATSAWNAILRKKIRCTQTDGKAATCDALFQGTITRKLLHSGILLPLGVLYPGLTVSGVLETLCYGNEAYITHDACTKSLNQELRTMATHIRDAVETTPDLDFAEVFKDGAAA